MDLNHYFDPVGLDSPENSSLFNPAIFCRNITTHTPDTPIGKISDYDVAIFGVCESRDSLYSGCEEAPDEIRKELYQLIRIQKLKIIDLGNLKQTANLEDTQLGLRDVLVDLLENGVIPIVMGGSKNLSYSFYLAQQKIKEKVNLLTADATIEFAQIFDEDKKYFLDRIVTAEKNSLFEFTNIGYQSCFVDKDTIADLGKYFYRGIRLGMVRNKFKEIEPDIRDADIVSFCMSSIKQSDAPAAAVSSPNGFYAEEACQIARYAGLSNKNAIFALLDMYPQNDVNQLTASLAAQMIWYFMEAVTMRKKESQKIVTGEYKKYIVNLDEANHDLVFYKNIKSERWWLEIPYVEKKNKHEIIACSEEDYAQACNHEIPNRWWKMFQKIN